MSRVTDSVHAVNTTIRSLLAVVLVVIFGALGWVGYNAYIEPGRDLKEARAELDELRRELESRSQQVLRQKEQIGELVEEVEQQQRQIVELETSLRLLKVDHRLAELRVIDQEEDAESGRLFSTVEFVEINDEGAPIDEPKQFTIRGDIVYIEAKVVQFEDRFVEQADPDRSTSLCLFQRIWGEYQEPQEGFALDEVGTRPTAYARGGELSAFERRVWEDFWEIANNPSLAGKLGVRTVQIEAPGMKVRTGNTYRVKLRASGGLTINLVDPSNLVDPPDQAATGAPDA